MAMNRPIRQYKRSARFNSLLQEEISAIIRSRLKDPRIGFLSITHVETTEDLRSAKVYVSVLEESEEKATLEGLTHASGMLRSELLRRLRIRRVPQLKFLPDRNIAYSIHIGEVLDSLKIEEPPEENDQS
jgi:ribosome-binding factor A